MAGDPDTDGDGVNDRTPKDIADKVCTACHSEKGGPSGSFLELTTCDNPVWKAHGIDGRLSEKVWEFITVAAVDDPNGDGDLGDADTTTCGW